jgi:hypothetical protein
MMSEKLRIVIRRPRKDGHKTEVLLSRGRHTLAVLNDDDEAGCRLIGLLRMPARQLPFRAEWLHAGAATAQEHVIIDAIVAYRMDGEHLAVLPQPVAMSPLAPYPAARAQYQAT